MEGEENRSEYQIFGWGRTLIAQNTLEEITKVDASSNFKK